jgi:porin
MMMRFLALAIMHLAASIAVTGASAQSSGQSDGSDLWSRATLLDGPGNPKEALRSRGIVVDVSHAQFYQGMVSGTGPNDWEYGGKVDAIATLDGAKLGLWQGLYVNIHQEWVYGDDVNNRGGTAFPENTVLAFPRTGGFEHDTSIIVTQIFSPQASVTAGKFNMLDVLAKTPILGGGGVDTFMHIGFAAPVTGITPPYLLGANLTVKTEPAIFSFMVYDPRNAQNWDVFEHPLRKARRSSAQSPCRSKSAA